MKDLICGDRLGILEISYRLFDTLVSLKILLANKAR